MGTRHRRRGQELDGGGKEGVHTNKVAHDENTEEVELRTDGKHWAWLLARGSL